MCTSPKIVRNPRKRFIPYVDKEYISVPCGHCKECRDKKRNDLFVLSYYEHLNAVAHGGFTQFFTLTYDEDHLPTHGGRPCFSRKDVQDYFKRVVTRCRREFGNHFKLRRLVTCERGTKNGRPHYHFLCYIMQPCNHFKFRKILRECWSYGFSFGSWDNFGEVNRSSGIRYVTKYVAKDCFEDEEDRALLEDCKEWSEKAYFSKRRVLPFVLHSKRFGYSAIDHLYGKSFIPSYLQLPLETILKTGCICAPNSNGYNSLVPIPRTLLRQLIYDVTWRYKRITKRDKALHECRDTPCPKKKVQSYYIPNHLYKAFKSFEIERRLEDIQTGLSQCSTGSDNGSAFYSLFEPEFCLLNEHSDMSDDELISQILDINIVRDPIFERDPFDRDKFYYKRAPLERTDFPQIRKKMSSLYHTEFAAMHRRLNEWKLKNRDISSKKNRIIEKTFRDNKVLSV